ncbi:diaminopimelate decarboxylase [Corynebacterium sp. 3HC-13]|uniref:FAD/NAD(P)-binding protein n=1 Tax=Corynebacterium poyangense TaxID=2684405 RepID=UPI001CC977E7|nr:FAD/NAD(P)-binding protein [Corynebacterium poyangense]MBZ8177504.1 diaminopimelate decarboxylase [Corynebacterium poyangense]
MSAIRIAIVGAGPRGLWAAEEATQQSYERGVPVKIEVFDPGLPSPDAPHQWAIGARGAYRVAQPQSWRLNVISSVIQSRLSSFDQWRKTHHPEIDSPSDPFPPRYLVGAFLRDSWMRLDKTLPSGSTLVFHPHRIASVHHSREDNTWTLETSDHTITAAFDEVLLCTGHADTWPGALAASYHGPIPLLGTAHDQNTYACVEPHSHLAVRGAALSFIDVALSLTEGRGGKFIPQPDNTLRYQASGNEPASLIPCSRHDRLMEVKADVNSSWARLDREDIMSEAQFQVSQAHDFSQVIDIIENTAQQLGARTGHTPSPWPATAEEQFRLSIAVAEGTAPPTVQWLRGLSWREVYPAVIQWVARIRSIHAGDLPTQHHLLAGLKDYARELEPLAFGPPLDSAKKILALIDVGIIQCSFLGRADELLSEEFDVSSLPVDGIIDAVIAPPGVNPGTLEHQLCEVGLAQVDSATSALITNDDGSLPGAESLAVIGRATELYILGNDTLSRTLHQVIPRWSKAVFTRAEQKRNLSSADSPTWVQQYQVEGIPPLEPRLAEWMRKIPDAGELCSRLIEEYGSPVNLINPAPLSINAAEFQRAGAELGIDVRVFFARKANKALGLVEEALRSGHGIDVASLRELEQVLRVGVPGERIIVSAAIKTHELLHLAISNACAISVDSTSELHRIADTARSLGVPARIAPRVAVSPQKVPPTRFGERSTVWRRQLAAPLAPELQLCGFHVHLHGYAAQDRAVAILECLDIITDPGVDSSALEFIDIGGGAPMCYLENQHQWQHWLQAQQAMAQRHIAPFTWKGEILTETYPYYQQPVRGQWLQEILSYRPPHGRYHAHTIAQWLNQLNLRLHLEPGRSLLDGCGLTIAEVMFLKHRSDGVPLIGVGMNRTQCRSTSADFLVDPILIRHQKTPAPTAAVEGFMVGAYCIEDELIFKRALRFPKGVQVGDFLAIPNTGGYLMHILESASHQIPLAKNLIVDPRKNPWEVRLDAIDTPSD